MARRSSFAGQSWTIVGLVLAAAHLALLASVALFDDGRLAEDWVETVPYLLLAAMPAVLAAIGLRNPGALVAAALVSVPLSLISMAGATLPLIIPALCYVAAYITSADAHT
jgi:hypothetical protein